MAAPDLSGVAKALEKVKIQQLDYSFGYVSARNESVSLHSAIKKQHANVTVVYAIRSPG